MDTPVDRGLAPLLVVCLCAEWCSGCREYRPTFDALAARFFGDAEFAWVDVENESDALGDPEIETFPTLLVEGGGGLFLGPVLPQRHAAESLLQSALAGRLGSSPSAAEQALADRVRRLVGARRHLQVSGDFPCAPR